MKRVLQLLLVCVALGAAWYFIDDHYNKKMEQQIVRLMDAMQEQPKIVIEAKTPGLVVAKPIVEAAGIKVTITKDDDWKTVAMVLVTILGTFFGIKSINRLFEK